MLSKTGKLIGPLTIFTFLAIRAGCLALPSGSAGPGQWAVLEVGPGTIHLGTGTTAGPPNYFYDTASDNPQALLNQAHNDAIAASAVAISVPKTSTLASINLRRATLTLAPGVYDLSKFQLDHSTLTLSGSGYFIFNITGNFQFNSGKVLLSSGAMATNVLFSVTSTHDVQFSGGTGGAVPGGPDESVLHGIILALNARIQLAPGLVVGEIISGNDISIASGAMVQNPRPPAVPDGASTLSLTFIALGALAAFRSLVIRNLSFRLMLCW